MNICPGFCSDPVNVYCFLKAQTAEILWQCPVENVFICVNEDYNPVPVFQQSGNRSNKVSSEQLPW